MDEPSFIRISRPSRQTVDIFPRCARCGRLLRRLQRRWCSRACAQYGWRMQRELDQYWRQA